MIGVLGHGSHGRHQRDRALSPCAWYVHGKPSGGKSHFAFRSLQLFYYTNSLFLLRKVTTLHSIKVAQHRVVFLQPEQLQRSAEISSLQGLPRYILRSKMFARTTQTILSVFLLFVVFAASMPTSNPQTNGDCDTGPVQCCDQLDSVSSSLLKVSN